MLSTRDRVVRRRRNSPRRHGVHGEETYFRNFGSRHPFGFKKPKLSALRASVVNTYFPKPKPASASVKVKRFDDDHQELFRIINTLHDGMMARRGQEVLQKVLDDLLNYTEGHFS